MASIKSYLRQDEIDIAKMWLKHVFAVAINNIDDEEFYIDHSRVSYAYGYQLIKNDLNKLNYLISDTVFVTEYDEILSRLCSLRYADIPVKDQPHDSTKFSSYKISLEYLCAYIAYMLKASGVYFYDIDKTQHEIDDFLTSTFGQTIKAFKLFASDINTNVDTLTPGQELSAKIEKERAKANKSAGKISAQQKQGTLNQQASTQSDPSHDVQQPTTPVKSVAMGKTNAWKASGPLSGSVRDLIGTPGQKLQAESDISYKIVDTLAQGNGEARAYIRPMNKKGEINGTNKVFIGTSRNYGDLVCYFDNISEANKFLDKVKEMYKQNGQDDSGLTLVKVKSSTNGYFTLGTEFGAVGIRASDLNEEIENFDDDEILEEDANAFDSTASQPKVFNSDEDYAKAIKEVCENFDKFMG